MSNYKKFEDMIVAAKDAILNSSEQSSVYIGCDSLRRKKNGKFFATYATVIIVHKDSKHGGQIFAFIETVPDYGSMKNRLIQEAGYAINAGTAVVDILGNRHLEIHLDLNPNPRHKSSVAIKEASSWVLGTFGFRPQIKPYSFAATSAADHITRH